MDFHRAPVGARLPGRSEGCTECCEHRLTNPNELRDIRWSAEVKRSIIALNEDASRADDGRTTVRDHDNVGIIKCDLDLRKHPGREALANLVPSLRADQ